MHEALFLYKVDFNKTKIRYKCTKEAIVLMYFVMHYLLSRSQ